MFRNPLSKLPPEGAWKLTSSVGGVISEGVDDGEYCVGESMSGLVVGVQSQARAGHVATRPALIFGVSNSNRGLD